MDKTPKAMKDARTTKNSYEVRMHDEVMVVKVGLFKSRLKATNLGEG
jgi:hypothetical protein